MPHPRHGCRGTHPLPPARFDEAQRHARRALELRPDGLGAQLVIAALCVVNGRLQDAETILNRIDPAVLSPSLCS
jgi:Flp pilus assembly protein TadD